MRQLPLARQAASTASRSRRRRNSSFKESARLLAAAEAAGEMCCSLSNKDSAEARMMVVLKVLLISPGILPRKPSEQSNPCARLKLAVRDSATIFGFDLHGQNPKIVAVSFF